MKSVISILVILISIQVYSKNLEKIFNPKVLHEGQDFFSNSRDISSDNKYIATLENKTVTVLEFISGKVVFKFEADGSYVYAVRFNPDGKYIMVSSRGELETTIISVYSIATQKKVMENTETVDNRAPQFSPNGKFIVSSNSSPFISVPKAYQPVSVANDYQYILPSSHRHAYNRHAYFSNDGNYLAFSGHSEIHFYNATTTTPQFLFGINDQHLIDSLVFSPDNKYMASLRDQESAAVYDLGNQKKILEIVKPCYTNDDYRYCPYEVRNYDLEWAKFSPDSKYFAISFLDGSVSIYNTNSGKVAFEFESHIRVSQLAFSPDSKYFARSSGSTVYVHDISTGKEIFEFTDSRAQIVTSVKFSANGEYILTTFGFYIYPIDFAATKNAYIRTVVHEFATRKEVFSLINARPEYKDNYEAEFIPGTKYFTITSDSSHLSIYDLLTAKEVFMKKGIGKIRFTSDGKYIVGQAKWDFGFSLKIIDLFSPL